MEDNSYQAIQYTGDDEDENKNKDKDEDEDKNKDEDENFRGLRRIH